MSAKERLKELADFLRTRRARLSPQQVGLPPGSRRRVPGLQPEEVAELADISVTWYTWLEQARPINVSLQVLERLSRSLRLDRHEQEHLCSLAGYLPSLTPATSEPVTASMQEVITRLNPNPAYFVDQRWDLMAWNHSACLVFDHFDTKPLPKLKISRP